jgi:hypothetical protein
LGIELICSGMSRFGRSDAESGELLGVSWIRLTN